MRLRSGQLYEFGSFVLDANQHLLFRDGNPVSLTPKTYDLLQMLLDNSGRLLPKDELIKALWPNNFVEESNLTQQMSALRRALGEIPGEDRYIVTVPGRGYRFAATVSRPVPDESVANELVADELPGSRRRRVRLAVAMGALAAVFSGLGYYALHGPAHAMPRSLAILPFQSLKPDEDSDFLGLSLADAVITKLGAVRSLTTRPSSAIERYRRQPVDFQRAAKELHVDTVLTGNFLRDGSDLRITSQLIDIKTQAILWKGAFDLKYDKILTVQDTVALQIVKGLQLTARV